jgi:hypothetical protein
VVDRCDVEAMMWAAQRLTVASRWRSIAPPIAPSVAPLVVMATAQVIAGVVLMAATPARAEPRPSSNDSKAANAASQPRSEGAKPANASSQLKSEGPKPANAAQLRSNDAKPASADDLDEPIDVNEAGGGTTGDAPGHALGDALITPRIPVAGPSIAATLSAAYAAAGLDHDPSQSWIRRARIGGLVPWVTVRTTRDTSWQDGQSEVGHGTTLELRATWRLDRLVFDGRELQVAAIEAARRRERRRLANRVIRSYFTWRRAAEAALDTADDRVMIRVAETTAELDALTEGWFSDELSRRRQRSSSAQIGRTAPP